MDKNTDHPPLEKTVTIVNRLKHQSEVRVRKDGHEVSGKSIMGVMMLAAAQGSHITLVAQGPDAAEALEALAALVANRFEEEA